jgi:hypothetical protein
MVGFHTHRACYIGMPLYICGFLVLGAAFELHLSVGAVVMGWGIAEVAVMVHTVAIREFLHVPLLHEDLKALRLSRLRQRLFPEAPGRD